MDPRLSYFLLAVAGVFPFLGVARLAQGQVTPATIQQEQSAQSDSTADQAKVRRRGQLGAFREFIDTVGAEDDRNQREIQAGLVPDDPTEDWPKKSMRIVHLREDELQAMYTIVLDAHHQVQENDSEWSAALYELRQNYSPAQQAQVDALAAHRSQIYRDAIAKLKKELGEDSFKILDTYIYQAFHGSEIIKEPPNVKTPGLTHPESAPAQTQPRATR
jgi:hypothetical protein